MLDGLTPLDGEVGRPINKHSRPTTGASATLRQGQLTGKEGHPPIH